MKVQWQVSGRGRWYRHIEKPKRVLGFWFKPSIKGVWWVEGKGYAVLINPRKGQPLFRDHVRFLARGIYELHCVEDPNDPVPLIIDVSAPEFGKSRILRTYEMPWSKPFHPRQGRRCLAPILESTGACRSGSTYGHGRRNQLVQEAVARNRFERSVRAHDLRFETTSESEPQG